MSVKHLTSRDNPAYRHLHALSTSSRVRRQAEQTLLDGDHLIEAALSAGCAIEQWIFVESCPPAVQDYWQARAPRAPAVVLSDALFRGISPVVTPTGLLAVIATPRPAAGVQPQSIVLLEALQDPGNLGAVLRAAAASGCDAVHLSLGCAEAWSPKCLRGGQGAQFALRIYEGQDLPAVARHHDGPVYAGVLGARQRLYDLDLRGPVGFAFGNEGAGLSAALAAVCQPFVIPMPGQVESLNVATAAAICLFERVRQIS